MDMQVLAQLREWLDSFADQPALVFGAVLVGSLLFGLLWLGVRLSRRRVTAGLGAVVGRVGTGILEIVGFNAGEDQWRARFEELDGRNQELRSFFVNFPEHVEKLSASLELDQVMSVIVRAAADMLDARSVQLLLLGDDDAELTLMRSLEGCQENTQALGTRFPADATPQAWLLTQQTAAFAEDWPHQHRGAEPRQIVGQKLALPIQLAVPIRLGEKAIGLLITNGLRKPTEHHQSVLSCWANVAAFSLENSRRMGHTRELADTDRMTGLYNHARFHQDLAVAFASSQRTSESLSIILLDIDSFKTYNDVNGHPAGDQVLKRFASVLTEVLPADFHVARYGGEEFVVILPGQDESEAVAYAEQIRVAVRERNFKGGPTQPLGRVTVSSGVAECSPALGTPLELVTVADQALYASKHGGRDRVTPASELGRAGDRRSAVVPRRSSEQHAPLEVLADLEPTVVDISL